VCECDARIANTRPCNAVDTYDKAADVNELTRCRSTQNNVRNHRRALVHFNDINLNAKLEVLKV
jgi:hypothetical protein